MTKQFIYSCMLALAGALPAEAQNTPLLTQTAPAGTVTSTTPVPPAITVNTSELYNYIRTFVPKQPVADAATLTTATAPATAAVSTAYLDGFRRTMETVSHNFHEGKSLVQPADTRFQTLQKGYLPYTATGWGFRAGAFSEQVSYYSTAYAAEGSTAYTLTQNLSDDDNRMAAAYVPGKSQVGQARSSTARQVANDASQIRKWRVSYSGGISSSGYYRANELMGTETLTPEGGQVLTFADKNGRTIYTKELLETVSVGGGGISNVEGITYYLYDIMGRLCYILPPRAMEIVGTGASVTATVRNNLCFQYQYDSKGRLRAERKPGEEAFTEIVYDRKDRVVLRRSPLEAAMGKWEVTFYDRNNRVIATSLYSSTATQATWQADIDALAPGTTFVNTNILHYMATDGGEGQYPATISGNEVMSYSYYDHYNYSTSDVPVLADAFNAASFPEAPLGADLPAERSLRTQGMLTASRVRVVKGSGTGSELRDWVETVNYYDDKGRVVQQRIRNATRSGSTPGKEIVCNYYDYRGKPLLSSHYHENKKTSHAANEYTRYSYDAVTGRLTETGHKVNEDTWKTLNRYEYDDLGRVSRKVLGNYGEVQDYAYNIRGQLTAINGKYAETANKEGQRRSYGESLKYDYGFSAVRYDGKITGMVWRGSSGAAMGYGYTYDKSGRLTRADFRRSETSGWSNTGTDYSVSHITYDVGGNITSMKQRGMGLVSSSIVPVDMDRLNYNYEATSNRLASVYDTVTTDYSIGDFQNSPTHTTDYDYDESGNLVQDLNKGISAVVYTWFNKPQTVTFSNGNTITYIYDAAGTKLQEKVTTGSTVKNTDYVGNFIYENDVLKYLGTAEGRTVYNTTDGSYKEEFYVKDHLGNVRTTVDVYTYPISSYLATYEVASAALEGLVFDKVSEIAEDNPDSPDPEDLQSGMLNGSISSKRVGTSLLLEVMAGDRVELNVNSYYTGYNPGTDAPVNAGTMLSSIVSTLTTGTGGLGGGESHNPQLVGSMFNSTNYTQFDNIVSAGTDGSKPRAYLNYILFSPQMQVIGAYSGAYQADGNGSWSEIGTTEPMEIPTNGYLAVYLTNGSTQNVFFDQLVVRFTKGNLLEENHYYPHGLPMGNIGSTASGFMPNRVKHQSNEYIKDAGLNWMDFNFRQYDPQIGRFLSVDPLAASHGQEVWSPYAAMGNAPESIIDPNGLVGEHMELPGKFMDFLIPQPFLSRSMQSFALGDMQGYLAPDPEFEASAMEQMFEIIMARALGRTTGGGFTPIGVGSFICNFGGTSDGGGSSDLVQQGYGDIAVFFTGANFGQGMTPTVLEIASGVAEGRHLEYSVYSSDYVPGVDVDDNTDAAFNHIVDMKGRFPNGGRVLLYGYSYGGVLVNRLAKRLDKEGISVDYMATVDAANGWGSGSVNRTISGNVKYNDNFYQTNTSFTRDPTMSHGGPNTGMGTINNYHMRGVNHMSIDEATSNFVTRMMRAFLTR